MTGGLAKDLSELVPQSPYGDAQTRTLPYFRDSSIFLPAGNGKTVSQELLSFLEDFCPLVGIGRWLDPCISFDFPVPSENICIR